METLVIVHLSSIDSYRDFYGVDPAIQLAADLKVVIITHPGPVVVMDQECEEIISEDAKVLRASVLDLQRLRDITIFHHDELVDVSPWQDGMKRLAKVLRGMGTTRVRLGGLWASESGTTGCVHETQGQLRARNIPCWIDHSLVALEENDKRAQ